MHDTNNPAFHHLCEIRPWNAVSQKVMAVFFYNDENKWRPRGKCKEEKKALHLWGARPVIFAAVVPSAALSGHLSSAGFSQSLKAPLAQRPWSTWQNAHNCVYLQGTTPEKAHGSRSRPRAKPAFISCSFIFSSTGCTQLLRIALICKISEVSSSNDLKGTRADSWTSLQLSGVGFFICRVILTMSLLSMPTFLRLAATEPMSFSESQDLKSFTAKHVETPEQMQRGRVRCCQQTCKDEAKLG